MAPDTTQPADRAHPLLERHVIDATDLLVSVKDRHGRYVVVNRGFEDFIGLSRERIQGKTDGALNPQDIAERVCAHDLSVLETGAPSELDETVLGRDGRRRMRCYRFALLGDDGLAWGVCAVSALKDRADAARQERDRLMRLAGAVPAAWSPPSAAASNGAVSDDHRRQRRAEAALEEERRRREAAELAADEERRGREATEEALAAARAEAEATEHAYARERAELLDRLRGEESARAQLTDQLDEVRRSAAAEAADRETRATARIANAEAQAERHRSANSKLIDELTSERSRAVELAIALEREQAEREELARRGDELRAELEGGRKHTRATDQAREDSLQRELAAARDELRRASDAVAASEAATADERAAREAAAAAHHHEQTALRESASATQLELVAARDELWTARQALIALRTQLAAACTTAMDAQAEIERLRVQLKANATASSRAQTEIERLRAKLEADKAASGDARTEIERLRAELEEARAAARERARDAARGKTEPAAAEPEVAPRTAAAPSRLLAVQRKVAAKIAAATSVEMALRMTLTEVGGEAGWDVAVGWLPDRSRRQLRPAAVWCSPALAGTQFETQTWQATIHEGPPAVAQTWETRVPAWVEDLGRHGERARVRWARAAGLSTAAAVPIADDESPRGLLELYRREPAPRDDDMLEVLSTIGVQLAGAARFLELAEKPRWR